jgi:hypothetical protein
MMNIPMPNSVVSVTTKYRNISYYSKDEFKYLTKKGKVIKSPKWVSADSFCIETGDPKFPVSVIKMTQVTNIELVTGESISVRKFKVESKKGTYNVSVSGDHFSCDCIGFKYHSKCKHVTAVKEKIC